jgi:hypothetical protein
MLNSGQNDGGAAVYVSVIRYVRYQTQNGCSDNILLPPLVLKKIQPERRFMGKIRATNVVQDLLVEEHQKLVIEMRELSRELRDCVEEMRKAISSTAQLRGWSGNDLPN